MEIQITNNTEAIEIKVIGRVDTITAPEFESGIQEVLELSEPTIIVECKELSYVSSSGLRVFLKLLKSITANGGTLSLRNLRAEIKEVFDITGFSALFTII